MSRGLLDDRPPPRPAGGWLLLLSALLVLWEPLSFALAQSSVLATLADRGPLVWLVLALRVVVLGLGLGAGMSIWHARPQGIILARAFFVLSAGLSTLVLCTSFYPVGLAPDLRTPVLTATLAYCGGWLLYLHRSVRVRRLLSRDAADG